MNNPYKHRHEGQRNDPERTCELYQRGCLHGFLAEYLAGADYRRGIVDGNGGPCAELLLCHVEEVAERWEDEKRYRIEHEYHAERHRHLVFIGLDNRTYSRNGAAAADCLKLVWEQGVLGQSLIKKHHLKC